MSPSLIPDIVCLAICVASAWTDLRGFRIPNWLTLPGIGAGLLLNAVCFGLVAGWPGAQLGLVSSVAGCLLLAIVFGVFGALHFVGMGDVKLMAAVGALVGWPVALSALVYVTLAGGVLGVGYALARGRLGTVLRNIGRVGRRLVRRDDPGQALELTRVPYALAILAGTALTVAGRHWF